MRNDLQNNAFERYSVIMAVYKNDKPEWFVEALESILNQTVKSDDIVIVRDGPVADDLEKVLKKYEIEPEVTIVRLEKNGGLGNALNEGLKIAKNELVARMDADDISMLDRIERQIDEFNVDDSLCVMGGQVAEFCDDPKNILSYRKVPTSHEEIVEFSRKRSPFNHPTVMYKKTVIRNAGGYRVDALLVEDYALWLELIAQGYKTRNLDSVLVNYRINRDGYVRKKNWTRTKNLINLHKKYSSWPDFLLPTIAQLFVFLAPVSLMNVFYRKVLRK